MEICLIRLVLEYKQYREDTGYLYSDSLELFWAFLDIAQIAKNGTGHFYQGNDTGRNAEGIHSYSGPDAKSMNKENKAPGGPKNWCVGKDSLKERLGPCSATKFREEQGQRCLLVLGFCPQYAEDTWSLKDIDASLAARQCFGDVFTVALANLFPRAIFLFTRKDCRKAKVKGTHSKVSPNHDPQAFSLSKISLHHTRIVLKLETQRL